MRDVVELVDPAKQKSQGHFGDTQADSGLDIFGILRAILRHRWKILFIILSALLIAYLNLNQKKPLFTAEAEIILEQSGSPVNLGVAIAPGFGGDTEIQTELQVIRSRAILRTVIETLDLMRDPEFNPTAAPEPPAPLELWLIDKGWWPIDIVFKWPLEVAVGVLPEPPKFRTDEQIQRIAIDQLSAKTSVGNLRGTTIIRISVTAWTRQKSALIANAIAKAYIESRVEVKIDAQRFASQFIGARIVELREEVEAAEAKIQNFRSENSVVADVGIEISRYEEMQARVQGARTLSRDLSGRLERFEVALNSQGNLRAAARALADRRINALLTAGYEDQIRSEIEETAARLRADQQVAERRFKALSGALEEFEATLEAGSANLIRLRQLEREAEASRQLFETFLTRQKETAVQQDLAKPDARILTEANPPYRSSYPKPRRNYAIAAVLGLALALGLVFLLERSRNCFVNIEELEEYTNLSVLGSIHRHKNMRTRRSVVQHVHARPGGAMAEAIRNLRTSILMANVDKPPKVIVFTSSVPEEGKSLTTLLLGKVSAQMGKRVILIDADIRRRTLHNSLKIKSKPGLLALLRGEVRKQEAIKVDENSGLHALPVEETRASPPDLLASEAFVRMIENFKDDYDLILIDAPPVLPVPDARILAKLADALVYIVKWNDTPRDIVRHGLSSLTSIGVHISGLVFTQVDREKQQKYGYGYLGDYGYRSHKYYKKSDRYYTN